MNGTWSIRNASFLAIMVALAYGGTVMAGFPASTYPGCGDDKTLDACPPDMVNEDGSWRSITWSFVSFIPPGLERQVRPEELATGSGNWIDQAFQVSVGRYDVPIAVVDSGVRWYKSQFTVKTLLNEAELPVPIRADGSTCPNRDCNSDGWFTLADYENDPRVDITRGADDSDHMLDPSDLIATFSNGIDEDQNGYIDDIAGWDFMWNDNDPRASNDFYHGSAVMTDAAATIGETGSDLGYCPNCAILPIRVSDSFMGEANKIAQGVLYAVDRGAKVIGIAMGGVTNSQFLRDAFEYAHSQGVTIVVAIGDELSYHHLAPGVNDFTLPVHSIEFFPIYGVDFARTFLAYNGCNNYGAHLMLVATTNDCATGAVAVTSGIAGLVYSIAAERGFELTADEVRAILTTTADDINVRESQDGQGPYFPSHPGWDQFFGYGRVNARHALDRVTTGAIPPEAHLFDPRWYAYIDPRTTPTIDIQGRVAANRARSFFWELEWAPGADVRDDGFTLLASGSRNEGLEGLLYSWPVASIPTELLDPAQPLEAISGADALLEKLEKVNVHTITLRLRVYDDGGNEAEHRKTFFLRADPDLVPGFPIDMGPGESSPALADLDGDGVLDIIVGTSDGWIRAFDGGGAPLEGWPVRTGPMPGVDPSSADGHSAAAPYVLGGVVPATQGILGNVSVADLDGDGRLEVLAATLDGWLYVFDADGQVHPGFPVSRDPVGDEDTDETHQLDPGIAASPAPYDLDGDGFLEIVLPAMDQKLYVWRHDGSRQPGFPVVLAVEDTDQVHNVGRIFSSPIIGDITGDGIPEIITGSNEYVDELPFINFVYAIHPDGDQHPGGPFLQGWPATVIGLLSAIVPYMGDGMTTTPVFLDLDGDGALEVAVAPPGGVPVVLDAQGRVMSEMAVDLNGWGADTDTLEAGALPYLVNLAVGDVDLDGDPDLVAGMTAGNWGVSLLLNRWMPYQDHLVAVWDAGTGQCLQAWPRVIEDIAMFVKPTIADISGDGLPEVITSSGGYVIHAWDVDGIQPDGWPKFTGGWVATAIRTGDITGDGGREVVALTREGYLWAWRTSGAGTTVP